MKYLPKVSIQWWLSTTVHTDCITGRKSKDLVSKFRLKKNNHMSTKNKSSTRYYSNAQEEAVAKLIGAQRQTNSGASLFAAGDLTSSKASLLVECKTCTTNKESLSVKKEWITKSKEEAHSKRLLNSCIAFSFGPDEPNYFIIDEKLMRFLVEKLEEDYE